MTIPVQPGATPSSERPSTLNPLGSNGNGVAATTPWARQAAPGTRRTTARARRLVEGLPDWEPLPPGEVLVRRRPG